MNIAWILCETCIKLNAHFIHKKTSSVWFVYCADDQQAVVMINV